MKHLKNRYTFINEVKDERHAKMVQALSEFVKTAKDFGHLSINLRRKKNPTEIRIGQFPAVKMTLKNIYIAQSAFEYAKNMHKAFKDFAKIVEDDGTRFIFDSTKIDVDKLIEAINSFSHPVNDYKEDMGFYRDDYKNAKGELVEAWSYDGNIDVKDFKFLLGNNDTQLKLNLNKVNGDFVLKSENVTSLKGCPREVGGNYKIEIDELTSLEEGPIKVGSFEMTCLKVNTLEHSPQIVNGSFYVYDSWGITDEGLGLTSLKGCPHKINGSFSINAKNLGTLKYGPKEVVGYYICSDCGLKSLEGIAKIHPDEKGESRLDCMGNKLTTLEYIPKVTFILARRNNLKTIEHIKPGKLDTASLYVKDRKDGNGNLEYEEQFLESGAYKEDYWLDLFNWAKNNKAKMKGIDWSRMNPSHLDKFPEEQKNLLASLIGLDKYNL
jgi:hypothetical protein